MQPQSASSSARCLQQQRHSVRQLTRLTGRCCEPVKCQLTDNTVRVKGDVKRVSTWVGNFQNLPKWYPGVEYVQRLKGEGDINLKTQFEVHRTIVRMQHTSKYEVVDLEPGRRIAYSATSPLHTATHQIFFQPDPNDPSFTNIRYIKRMQLRSLAGPLQPVVSGFLKKLPEDALQRLTKLLSLPDTPLKSVQIPIDDQVPQKGAWSWQAFIGGSQNNSSRTGRPMVTPRHKVVDTLGYYTILGLEAKRALTADDIKAAYRKQAKLNHPDTFAAADEAVRGSAGLKFQRVQKAYEVLKNPEHKKLYDAGELVEELVA